jgi:outer membrane protein OmpA-like peptidoglycan-associated protein
MANTGQLVQKGYGKIRLLFVPALLCCLFSASLSAPLWAQTAQRVENVLEKQTISWSESAVFVLEAADLEIFLDLDEAFTYAWGKKWLPKNAKPGEPARYGGLSLLLMRAFDIKGGLFYTMTKSPHYAYRELLARDLIQGRTDPGMRISGPDFLFTLGRILSLIEDAPTGLVEREEPKELTEEEIQRWAEHEALAEEINVQLAALPDIEAKATDEGVMISISNIQFLANSAELAAPEKEKLREIAEILKTIPGRRIQVVGHTALAGTRAARQKTSFERAQAVADYLIVLGTRMKNEISVVGYGADRPIDSNYTPAGMASNRRVEIIIMDN